MGCVPDAVGGVVAAGCATLGDTGAAGAASGVVPLLLAEPQALHAPSISKHEKVCGFLVMA